MLVLHSPASILHDPEHYFRRGAIVGHPEQAERYTILRNAIAAARHRLEEAGDRGLSPIRAIHTRDYIEFLRTAWERRAEIPGSPDEVLANHFARPQMRRRPKGLLGLAGYHTADTSTPIRAGTWDAVYGSAQAAIAAADAAAGGGVAYALCRPPGHHAYADSAGGFCFLNGTAIAAERLRQRLGRVAILDIDVHHGNGTQGIFYGRGDILTVSIHADPADYFPYFAGYADEIGEDEGRGCNLNIPLAHGSGDEVFLRALERALGVIGEYRPAALVVALGLDASEHDPIGALKVTTDGFGHIARMIASAALPTALVQEGGYLCEALPRNLVAFLAGFEADRSSNASPVAR